ncbi:ferritin-like domain-containing protein [Calidithermus chliarophilus]|uniref:ferritin-like domain-containing protein n=1 Tax=Calidithermus chliarophilus TaxID=52023 RepID=UPI00041FD9E3|nr:ferritin-like domain-containing protein [Calidithermus chliarophilus]
MIEQLLRTLETQKRQQLLQVLAERYRDEISDAALAKQAAEGLPYSHLRQTLERIAQREQQHAEWLADKIRALGGTPPPPPTISDQATWHELLAAYESEKADKVAYLENSLPDEELEALFHRIAQEEQQNIEELRQVITRIDPYDWGA